MKKTGLYVCATLLLPALLAACSGGGANALPLASAGIAQVVNEKTTVNLDGRDSSDLGGKIAGYVWTQVSGDAVVLANATTATPSFTAPLVSNLEGSKVLVFKLVVTDNQGAKAEDTVKVTISAVNEGAIGTISAGNNQSVLEGAVVKLGGVASGQEGDITYKWEQIGGTAVKLTGDTTLTPSFTAPAASANNNALIFSLTVSGEQGVIAMDTVTVSVGANNKNPVASAGSDLEVNEGSVVKLSGGGTDPNGDTLTYTWVQTSGKYPVVLTGANTATPSFTAPQVTADATLIFTLTTNDGHGGVSTDTVNVAVKKIPNIAPVANAGADQVVNEKASITLSGSGSDDDDGKIASYAWTQSGGGAITLSDPTKASISFTTPTVTNAQASDTLLFKLTVTDDKGKTDTDTVSVTVKAVNESPTASAGAAQQVNEGTVVNFVGTATDPDGDTLTYSWARTDAASTTLPITLSGATTLTPSFTAPAVLANTTLTFVLTVSDGRTTGTASISVLVKDNPVILPTPTGKLNDTGITLCGNATGNSTTCTQTGFLGQDAEKGLDATHATSNDADGRRGFNFTKLNSAGQALAADAAAWSCVKDNVTGLIWEVKTDDAGLHDKDWTYTWYSTDSRKNGNDPGAIGTSAPACGSTSVCDTESYVTAVNAAGWCGATGWRLPTVNELQGIADFSLRDPVLGSGYFPNTAATVGALYWSETPYSANNSFGVDGQGKAVSAPRSTNYSVRLVRSQ